jgi:NADPH:quinone reductase-like Zn-dependent oxidoreductase
MWAASIDAPGPPAAINWGRLPLPGFGPADVLVHVEAVAVNRVDTFVRSGAYPTPMTFPFVVGRDLVGTVSAAGPGATGFEAGQAVWSNSLGYQGRQGCTAEYAVVPADRLYHLPAGADPVRVVAVVHPAATAHLALFGHGRLRAGETVLVAGGAGHVGRAAIVLASRAGARVVATASADDLALCLRLGAQAAVDYRDPGAGALVREAAPDSVDVYLDTSGHHDLDLAVDLAGPAGRIVLMAGLTERAEVSVGALYTKDIQILGFAISNATSPELAVAAARVNQLVAADALDPGPVEVSPMRLAAAAHERLETARAARTRLVLRSPTSS